LRNNFSKWMLRSLKTTIFLLNPSFSSGGEFE
jgi:hypothetical protein